MVIKLFHVLCSYNYQERDITSSFFFILLGFFDLILSIHHVKADLLAQYGGVAPKMAEEAHLQVIDQVLFLHYNHLLSVMFHCMI